jgi:hypothetical protein
MTSKRDGGKGDTPRPIGVTMEEFDKSWDAIFGEAERKKQKQQEKERNIKLEINVENQDTDVEVTKTWKF